MLLGFQLCFLCVFLNPDLKMHGSLTMWISYIELANSDCTLLSASFQSEGSKSSATFRKKKVLFFLLWDGSLQPPWSVVYLFVEGNCWHFVDIQHFKPTNPSLSLAVSGRSYFLWCKFCLTIPVKKCMNHFMVNIAFGTALNVNSFLIFVNIPLKQRWKTSFQWLWRNVQFNQLALRNIL